MRSYTCVKILLLFILSFNSQTVFAGNDETSYLVQKGDTLYKILSHKYPGRLFGREELRV